MFSSKNYPFHVQRYTDSQQQLASNLAGALTLAPEVKQAMQLPRELTSKRK